MIIVATWLGCGSPAPTRATEPDAEASRAIASALCRAFQTAERACKLDGNTAVVDGETRVAVDVFLDTIEERFGLTTLEGRVRVGAPDAAAVTHFRHYGMSRAEVLRRGSHHWAVVDGAAIIDWVLGDVTRPALTAMYSQKSAEVPSLLVRRGAMTVLPGWTYLEGVTRSPDHEALVAAMAPYVKAGSVHVVDLRIKTVGGKQEQRCYLDGEPADDLCAALPRTAFPAGIGWGLKQAWLWAPTADLPDPPVGGEEP